MVDTMVERVVSSVAMVEERAPPSSNVFWPKKGAEYPSLSQDAARMMPHSVRSQS